MFCFRSLDLKLLFLFGPKRVSGNYNSIDYFMLLFGDFYFLYDFVDLW
jgi:hypothetical protein